MAIFSRKKEKDYEDEEETLEDFPVKDLKPENRKKRVEPPKVWGKKERLTVLFFLLGTVLVSGILSAASRNWKLPGMPQISIPRLPSVSFDFLSGETITIGSGKKAIDPVLIEKADSIKKEFEDKTKNLSGTYSLYVVDLGSGYSFGANENEVLTAASLIKLPVIALIFQESEKGKLDLDEAPSGTDLTFRELAQEMGKKSNNQAQITAVKALGKESVEALISDLEMKETSYSQNETSAANIGLFFQKLWGNEIVSDKSKNEILSFLTDTIYEDWIKKGIPEVRVAHKYGREVHVISDAGIVFSKNPFALVIMSQGVVDKEADDFIPEFSGFVFGALNN